MFGMAILGVAADVARRVDTSIVGHEQDKLNAARFRPQERTPIRATRREAASRAIP